MLWIFLSSGMFLGWSLGANDAANVFGTAVSTKMLRFRSAAIITSIFLILGAMISGAGTTHTIGVLGDVNAIAGSFSVSLAAAISVFLLIKRGLPVSVSQAIVGAILGWNLFTSSPTDINSLIQILFSWVFNPLIAGALSFVLYLLFNRIIKFSKIHLLEIDALTRYGFILAAAFGAYSLGANNIAKVVGVFITSSPFRDIQVYENFKITALQQLFFTGALSMAAGIISYSRKTIDTIGSKIFRLTPISALASVFAVSVTLFAFSSQTLHKILLTLHIPAVPLVPVSVTQAMVGAVIGIALAKGGSYLNYKIIGKISLGWLITPVSSALISLLLLFVMQNVFQQKVFEKISFEVNEQVIKYLQSGNLNTTKINHLNGITYDNQSSFRQALDYVGISSEETIFRIFQAAKIENFRLDSNYAKEKLNPNEFTQGEIEAVKFLHNESYKHRWQVVEKLSLISEDWRFLPPNPQNIYYNKRLEEKYEIIFSIFKLR